MVQYTHALYDIELPVQHFQVQHIRLHIFNFRNARFYCLEFRIRRVPVID